MQGKYNYKKKKDSDSDDDLDFGDDDDITESKESNDVSKLKSFTRTVEKLDVDDIIKKLLTNKVRNIGMSGEVSEEHIIQVIEQARDIVT